MVLFGQSGIIPEKWVIFWQGGCIRTKVVVLGMCGYIQEKLVVFGQSGCNRAKNGCIRENWLYLVKGGFI